MAKQATTPNKPKSKKVDEQERLRMIADAAYLRAQARGFASGHEDADWLAAEAEVEARLRNGK
jgi:hypothetical protein